MQSTVKDWLVRTRTGEILGPYTQRELLEELQKKTFALEDEIAPSQGYWISAQALSYRDIDEYTHTSTRSQAITRSYQTGSVQTSSQQTVTPSNEGGTPPRITSDDDEITPTPDFISSKPTFEAPPIRRVSPQHRRREISSRLGPMLTLLLLIGGAWGLVTQMRARKSDTPATPSTPSGSAQTANTGDSPFVRTIYDLIARGDTQVALKQLTQFHERSPNKSDLEYLIPYSALLITEGESPARAKKFLEQVLTSPSTSPKLKGRAHHWMGYLLLSEEQGDHGESHFLESLQLNPKDAAARFNLARAYLAQDRFSQALDYLQLAELEMPDLWLIHLYKGRVKASLGQTEEARAAFKMALQLAPDRWLTHIYYAVFLSGISEFDAAQTLLKKMLTKDPFYEAYSPPPLGFLQSKVNYAEYLDAFNLVMDKALGEEKEIGKLYINYLLNDSAANEGRRIEAAAEKAGLMSKVLALKVVLDRGGSAEEIRAAASRLPPNLSDFGYYAYVLRGEAKSRLGNLQDALGDFQRALALEPKSAVANWVYAMLLKKSQRGLEAQNALKTLLSYHPNYIPAIVQLHNF